MRVGLRLARAVGARTLAARSTRSVCCRTSLTRAVTVTPAAAAQPVALFTTAARVASGAAATGSTSAVPSLARAGTNPPAVNLANDPDAAQLQTAAKKALSAVSGAPATASASEAILDGDRDSAEIKDPELIFKMVWKNLCDKHGESNLTFPGDLMFLSGAPGAGKGVMTPFIMQHRGISAHPLEVSQLLTSPEALKLKQGGKLVGDRQVVELLFEALLRPEYESGVIVDGFPRTRTQAECIKMLYDAMIALRRKHEGSDQFGRFRRPIFHITVLFVEEAEAIRRQLARGQYALHHNQIVAQTGVGEKLEVRPTDIDATLARERYRHFRDQVYDSLQAIKSKFHFHFINAEGSKQEVQERIVKELTYQSSMELSHDTFEKVRKIPLASEIIMNARHELVKRLDHYKSRHSELFDRVVAVVKQEFLEIIHRQALSGKAIIRSENKIFAEQNAMSMALDLLCERGYTVVLDLQKRRLPERVEAKTGKIVYAEQRIYEFQIEFPKPTIRRG